MTYGQVKDTRALNAHKALRAAPTSMGRGETPVELCQQPSVQPVLIHEMVLYAPDKSSGRRLQEIEIIYNHIGEFDRSKVTLWKGNAV